MANTDLNVGPLRAGSSRKLDLRDERPHPPVDGDPYWTETVWFAALAPQEHLGCWVYLHLRPNLGISAAGIWIWDDTALVPWETPYTNFRWHMPMPTWENTNSTGLVVIVSLSKATASDFAKLISTNS